MATEMGSLSAGHLRRNALPHPSLGYFCHIPGILHVALSVVAKRMFWSPAATLYSHCLCVSICGHQTLFEESLE